MKKSICIIILALFAAQLWAQRWNNHQDETLVSKTGRSGFFVSPIIEYSDLQDQWNTSVGGGLAFVAGDFFIGGYGLGMVEEDFFDNDFEELKMGHGGFWVGYVMPQHKPLHLFTSVKAGWGAVNIDFDNDFDYEDSFFAVTPEAGLEVNVFRWFRIATAVGYRFVNGLERTTNVDPDEFEGMTGSLTFRIGGFGRSYKRDRWD